jgi:hypothetical protein
MISISELRDYLEIEDDQEEDVDHILARLESYAVAFVEKQTNRHFGPKGDVTVVVMGTTSQRLYLPYAVALPASSAITIVEERRQPGDTATEITTAASDGYILRTNGQEAWLVRKGGARWQDGYEYTVTFKRGYAPGYEPGDIRRIVLKLVELDWNSRGGEGVKSETISGYSYSGMTNEQLEDAIPGWTDTIESWRPPVIA